MNFKTGGGALSIPLMKLLRNRKDQTEGELYTNTYKLQVGGGGGGGGEG